MAKVCNRFDDCLDNSDEKGCGTCRFTWAVLLHLKCISGLKKKRLITIIYIFCGGISEELQDMYTYNLFFFSLNHVNYLLFYQLSCELAQIHIQHFQGNAGRRRNIEGNWEVTALLSL